MTTNLTDTRRFIATFSFQPVDRLIRREFYYWPQTIERWLEEGLPADWRETNYFGFDQPQILPTGVGMGWVSTPYCPRFEERTITDEGQTAVVQDSDGIIKRIIVGLAHGFMPTYLKFPVTCWEDWERDVAWRLDPETPERWVGLREAVAAFAARDPSEPPLVIHRICGAHMTLHNLFGFEGMCMAFYDQPELVHEVMRNWLHLHETVLLRIVERLPVTNLNIQEDLSYKGGMIFSPRVFQEFIEPYYSQLIQAAKSHGVRWVLVDSDGNVSQALPLFVACGADAMQPFEVAAGMDVVEVRKRYPRLVIHGGIDKRVLASDPESITRELRRVVPFLRESGGYIPHCDHGVPFDVSFANYMHYRNTLAELGG